MDASPERRGWALAEIPGVAVGASLSELRSRLRPDAVLISTPPTSHHAFAAEALRGGAHILIEKPMVLLPADADLLLQLAASNNRHIRVGFNRRYRPAYLAVRERLARTPKHTVRSARFELCTNPLDWGSYSGHLAQSGSGELVLEDIAAHQLDLLPWMLGRSVSAVRASCTRGTTLETLVELELRFSDGLLASCLAGHQPGFVERLEISVEGGRWVAGPAGLTTGGPLSAAAARRYLEARGVARAVARKLMGRPGDTLETFRRQLEEWARVLLSPAAEPGRLDIGADGRAGARCVALVDACRQSLAGDGAWIDVKHPP